MRNLAAFVFMMSLVGSAWAASPAPLRVGLLPTLSAKVLLTNYQPLRVYLERELQRPVELSTAPDFKRFQHYTEAGDFDLILTASHLARLAEMEGAFLAIATYLSTNRPILIVAKNSSVSDVEALRGRNFAIFDALALNVLHAREWLEDRGLMAGRDYRAVLFPSHNSVGFSVQHGQSLMGVVSPAGLKQLPPETLEAIRVFAELPPIPALIWGVHPRMKREADALRAVLIRFGATPEGRQFYSGNAYKGMRPVAAEELRVLDRPALEVKRLMQAHP